jgi:hypothetical protein
MQENEKSHIFDNPRNVKALIYGLFVLCAVLFGLDALIDRHAEYPWEAWFGFYCIYGFVACEFLVLAGKQLRKAVLRKDDYYDD